MTELNRILRHLLPPALLFAVGKGWIPAELQQPIIEGVIAAVAIVGAWLASRASDRALTK
jgi:hypothetical protein